MTITKREPNKRTDKGCILFPGGLGLRMENEYGRQLSWVMKWLLEIVVTFLILNNREIVAQCAN